ncbi:hypothetical protein RV14_GL002010 [Enterococcus ratti]|uniref:Uncharacterized protein n=1 Tax=Enterococcus ratti TaxID=150033 RepID=A0A1L8WPU0_9ENTE|nr:hypothetical protein RV14_GL002010 [Enterococcus ratti]
MEKEEAIHKMRLVNNSNNRVFLEAFLFSLFSNMIPMN